MPKTDDWRSPGRVGLQNALDALDVIGQWDWDIPNDQVRADALVALLFNVDPDAAEAGAPLTDFAAGIHEDDRERTARLIDQCAREGSSYVAEYRVRSADGRTRWVLARGRFKRDADGRPLRGHGVLVDITQSRLGEKAYVAGGILTSEAPADADATKPSLERIGELVLAAREAAGKIDQWRLRVLLEMSLLEISRGLNLLRRAAQRRTMQ